MRSQKRIKGYNQAALDYKIVENALLCLASSPEKHANLKELASNAGLSPGHFQRLFLRWAGVSPKKFLQYTTKEHGKILLRSGHSVLTTAEKLGLSSASRLYDLLVSSEAVTPGQLIGGGLGLEIDWGCHDSPFGPAFIAASDRGVCALHFLPTNGPLDTSIGLSLERLRSAWPQAKSRKNTQRTLALRNKIFSKTLSKEPLGVMLRGSPFQLRIWQALLQIPQGALISYGQLAQLAQSPGAARAVGSAMACNPIAYLIPCHRVIRQIGELGQYHWGVERKRAMIAWESAQKDLY